MSAQSNQRNKHTYHIPLGSPSADDAVIAGAYLRLLRKFVIDSVELIDGAGLVDGTATDKFVLSLKNGSTVVAQLDSEGAGAITADVPKSVPLVSGQEEQDVGTLTVQYDETDAGTNVALTNAVLVVHGWYKQSA